MLQNAALLQQKKLDAICLKMHIIAWSFSEWI